MRQRWNRFFLIVLVLFGTVGCDQTTKRVAEQTLKGTHAHSMLRDTVRLQFAENTGAFLGFGQHFPDSIKRWLFLILPFVSLLVMLVVVMFARRMRWGTIVSLSLLIGGGASNLLDRLVLGGKVTDFLNMGIGSLRTGIFNIADVAIMLGMAGIVWMQMMGKQEKPATQVASSSPLPEVDITGSTSEEALLSPGGKNESNTPSW
jgi:signal peptidase II